MLFFNYTIIGLIKMTDVPIDKVSAYVETYLSIKDRVRENDVERSEAFEMFAAAREKAGLETNESDFTTLCAADLRTLADDFSRFQVPEKEVFTVGACDSKTQKWV